MSNLTFHVITAKLAEAHVVREILHTTKDNLQSDMPGALHQALPCYLASVVETKKVSRAIPSLLSANPQPSLPSARVTWFGSSATSSRRQSPAP